MFFMTPGVIIRAVVWVAGCIVLWHFGKELSVRVEELRASRDRVRLREQNPGRDAGQFREEYRGDVIAFALICTLIAAASAYVFGGVVWFLASVTGCGRV